MTKKQEKVWQRFVRYTLNLILVLALGLLIFVGVSAARLNKDDAFLACYKPFVISSDSMAPTYLKNGLVLIKQGDFSTIKTGEMIAFKAQALDGKPAFHRVVEITSEGIVTKGDANKIKDSQVVTKQAYLGHEVWHTNITVELLPLLKTPKGIIYLVVLPVILIILLTQTVKTIRRERKPLETSESESTKRRTP